MYKNGQNWRQIFKSPTVEVCGFLKTANRAEYLESQFDYYQRLFPRLPSNCPVKPGRYEGLNVTVVNGQDVGEVPILKIQLPNGLHRHTFILTSKTDPLVYKFEWTNEVKRRLGDENF